MKTLHLLRHAQASRADADWVDFERPLSRRGERDAIALAQSIPAMSLRPQLILCSPALRTQQTYAAIASALRPQVTPRFEPKLYLAPARSLLSRLRSAPASVTELLLIGHNPGLEDLALLLIREAPAALRIKLSEKLPTCSLLTLTLELETWQALAPDCAILRRFWPIGRATRDHTSKLRTAAHAPKLSFDRHGSWAELAQAALENTRTHAYANLAGAAAGDVDSIHQLRVALRRLRVVLRTFDDVLAAETAEALNAQARSLFRRLGEVRELDVTDQTLLSSLIQDHPHEGGLSELRAQLLAARKQRLARVQHMLRGPQLNKLTRSLDAPRKRARKQLDKRLAKVSELVSDAKHADVTRLHMLRKELKQLRYRSEIFAPLFKSGRVRAYASVMSQLQDVLGTLNDVAAARAALRTSGHAPRDGASKRARNIANAALSAREEGARSELSQRLDRLVRATPFWC